MMRVVSLGIHLDDAEVMRMADEAGDEIKYVFRPLGILDLGEDLTRLEWATATIAKQAELASFLGRFRLLKSVRNFEDVGNEASDWHNRLSNAPQDLVADADLKNSLRDLRTKWKTLARERFQDCFLITPDTTLSAKKLLAGPSGFLNEEEATSINFRESSDFGDACRSILVRSYTASEFSSLRLAESLLRRWYTAKTQREIERKNWGAVIGALLDEYSPDGRPKKDCPAELTHLGYLAIRRNSVDHPQRVSTRHDAETTLMVVVGLILDLQPFLPKQLPLLPPENQSPTPELASP